MQYLTKNFYGKKSNIPAYSKPSNDYKDVKICINNLNKWLAKSDQQDVKVDAFRTYTELVDIIKYTTVLTIVYHYE